MKLKGLIAEDFCNYKLPSMFLITSVCDWKCCTEQGLDIGVCQNSPLAQQKIKEISNEAIYQAYINNPITKVIVVGGLEPMLQYEELFDLISYFRLNGCDDEFIIYTGYYPEELPELNTLKMFKNIIVKFGRFVPNQKPHYDEVLGVNLASDNQYAKKIS